METAKNNFYVYAHYSPLTGECFYIGKGVGNRAYKTGKQRNIYWRRKVENHGGFDVKILIDNLTEEQAYEVEESYIESIGLENLCNLTNGGRGGMSGWVPSDETRKKMGDNKRGKVMSEETRKKDSEAKIGDKNPMFGKFGKDSHSSKKVNQYSKDGQFIKTWNCQKDVERELGIYQANISKCCLGQRPLAGSFIWRYHEG